MAEKKEKPAPWTANPRATIKRCGDCLWCIKDEGEPYYCVMRDLYYFVTLNDKACQDFQEVEKTLLNL